MTGIAQLHFPRIVWREGRKQLWNPIHRKALKIRPEERVRLRIIDALVEAGWSKHRISTEEALPEQGKAAKRTDIICYDQEFNPRILVECKAESVPISSGVAEQTARYNQTVGAPYLLMTNGLRDYWYRITENNLPAQLNDVPDMLNIPEQPPDRDFTYWKDRGFAGSEAKPVLREWITPALNHFWSNLNKHSRPQFISFNNSPMEMELAHYFAITTFDGQRVACTFVSTPFGGSRLVGVINSNKENVALIEINLDLLATDTKPNATLHSALGAHTFDACLFNIVDLESTTKAVDPTSISKPLLQVYQELSE